MQEIIEKQEGLDRRRLIVVVDDGCISLTAHTAAVYRAIENVTTLNWMDPWPTIMR
jgi:hypothetical protein